MPTISVANSDQPGFPGFNKKAPHRGAFHDERQRRDDYSAAFFTPRPSPIFATVSRWLLISSANSFGEPGLTV